jgi:hypothetical protein
VFQRAGTDFSERHAIMHKANAGPHLAARVLVSPTHCKSEVNDANLLAMPEQRAKRGRSMARRSGQCGYLEQKGNSWYVRFWIDVQGQEKRAHKSVRICPTKGPGALAKPERERRAKEVIAASGADTTEHFEKVQPLIKARLSGSSLHGG